MVFKGRKIHSNLYLLLLLLLIVMAMTGCTATSDPNTSQAKEDPAAFFEGKTIRFLVPFKAGSSFDMYPRMMAPILEKEMGVTIQVENLTGAGGMLMYNELAEAKPDGLTLGIMAVLGAGMAQLGEAPGIEYDMKELTWIGRYVDEPQVIAVKKDSPWKTFDDILASDKKIIFGSTGYTASTYTNPLVVSMALDAPLDMITGYEGSDDVIKGVLRNDTDALAISTGSSRITSNIDEIRGLLLLASEPNSVFPDTPLVYDYAKTDRAKNILDTYIPVLDIYRSAAAPPGLSPEKTKYLREMFAKASNSEDYKNKTEKAKMAVNFLSGEEVSKKVEKIFSNPNQELVEVLKENYNKK